MSSSPKQFQCEQVDLVAPYALGATDHSETTLMEAHLPTCAECQREYQTLRPVSSALAGWQADAPPPSTALWNRLVERIDEQPKKKTASGGATAEHGWPEPQWREAAPGITCKLLSTDKEANRVAMLVRLAPGVSYPPHRHHGVEELFLMEGELWIEDQLLRPGDFNRAEPGTADQRVYSETGCMCLLITSPADQIR